jgi:putative ABC transport system substrate-binding protein
MIQRGLPVLAVALVTWMAAFAMAQEATTVHRIGYLAPRTKLEPPDEAFREELRGRGYIEGKNLIIEYRFGSRQELPKLAAELVDLNVDVILAPGSLPAKAAQAATRTIPIVFSAIADPVGIGLVASLAQPGGNVTGVTPSSAELSAKRVELLKEIFPAVTRIAVLSTPDYPLSLKTEALAETEEMARTLGVQLQLVEVQGRDDFDRAFAAVLKGRAQALTVFPIPLFRAERERIVDFATRNRLPTIFHWQQYVRAGGLMSYGPDRVALFRRAAGYVDKILQGVKPADLPVERASDFELVINLKAAGELGITIPPAVLYRADEIIQ